jgi:hypothetical protein
LFYPFKKGELMEKETDIEILRRMWPFVAYKGCNTASLNPNFSQSAEYNHSWYEDKCNTCVFNDKDWTPAKQYQISPVVMNIVWITDCSPIHTEGFDKVWWKNKAGVGLSYAMMSNGKRVKLKAGHRFKAGDKVLYADTDIPMVFPYSEKGLTYTYWKSSTEMVESADGVTTRIKRTDCKSCKLEVGHNRHAYDIEYSRPEYGEQETLPSGSLMAQEDGYQRPAVNLVLFEREPELTEEEEQFQLRGGDPLLPDNEFSEKHCVVIDGDLVQISDAKVVSIKAFMENDEIVTDKDPDLADLDFGTKKIYKWDDPQRDGLKYIGKNKLTCEYSMNAKWINKRLHKKWPAQIKLENVWEFLCYLTYKVDIDREWRQKLINLRYNLNFCRKDPSEPQDKTSNSWKNWHSRILREKQFKKAIKQWFIKYKIPLKK